MKKLLIIPLVSCALSVTHAATVGYWQFESGAFLDDSSANGNTLTNVNGMAQVAIPGSGNGSDFLTTIPQTGATNGSIADFTDTSEVSGFSASDSTSFNSIATSGALTIEAFINVGTMTDTGTGSEAYIGGQYDQTADARSWAFLVNSDKNLSLQLGNSDGSFAGSPDATDWTIANNTDYYVAATYSTTTDDVIFYLQDLTNSGTLLSQTVSQTTSGGLHNPSLNFNIGHRDGSDKVWRDDGFIDEVRLSNTVLAESELLAIPEPSTLMLTVIAMVGGLLTLRRRK